MMRTYSPLAARMPLFTAAPLPWLYGWRITRAPASVARVDVSSVEPSSTTTISCHGPMSMRSLTTVAMTEPSLNAGMTTVVDAGSATTVSDTDSTVGRRLRLLVVFAGFK